MTQVAPQNNDPTFEGFIPPVDDFFRLPTTWIDICADIDNLTELKVVQYVLRHTWGYQDFEGNRKITTDEFMSGRKRKDGTRIDKGTGLSDRGVKNGIALAIQHGYLVCETDDSDKGRIKKYYSLKMFTVEPDRNDVPPGGNTIPMHGNDVPTDRNTIPISQNNVPSKGEYCSYRSEKDTLERYSRKTTLEKQECSNSLAIPKPASPSHARSEKSSYSQQVTQATLLGDLTQENIASQGDGYRKSSSSEPKPIKPLMPPPETKWCAEIAVQIVEAKLGKYYRQASRVKQVNFAKRMFKDDPDLTREQFISAYDERNDDWWRNHKGLLHMQHMVEKDRVHEMLDKIEARKNAPSQKPQKPTRGYQQAQPEVIPWKGKSFNNAGSHLNAADYDEEPYVVSK